MLAILAFSGVALAAPRVEVPEGCGTVEEFEAELRKRFPRDVEVPPIALTITQGPERYQLRLSVGHEARELADADCRALFRAAVVVSATIVLSEKEAPPSVAPPAPSVPTPPPPPPPDASPSEPLPIRLGASLGVGVNVGLVPHASPAFTLEGRMLFARRFGVGLAGHYVVEASMEDEARRGVSMDAWGGRAFGLYQPAPYVLTGLGASAYFLDGMGSGPGAQPGSAWAAGPALGAWFVPLPRARIWLALGGELYWNLLRPRFDFEHHGNIFTSSLFSASLFISVGLHQP